MHGALVFDQVEEVRKGTVKEVQTITTRGGPDGVVNSSTVFYLQFQGAVTGPIVAAATTTNGSNTCDATTREVSELLSPRRLPRRTPSRNPCFEYTTD